MDPKFEEFLIKRTHLKREELRPDLRLAEDIGLYGLDAISFFEEFFAEFDIRNIEEFDADLHINGGPDFLRRPLKWINNIIDPNRRKYLRPDVTLGHLEKVLKSRRWTNER